MVVVAVVAAYALIVASTLLSCELFSGIGMGSVGMEML